jgi:hypothetical protein
MRLYTCRPEASNRLIAILKERDESVQEVVKWQVAGKPKYLAKIQSHYNHVHHKGYKICSEIELDPPRYEPDNQPPGKWGG